jgi:hypothetical protein
LIGNAVSAGTLMTGTQWLGLAQVLADTNRSLTDKTHCAAGVTAVIAPRRPTG